MEKFFAKTKRLSQAMGAVRRCWVCGVRIGGERGCVLHWRVKKSITIIACLLIVCSAIAQPLLAPLPIAPTAPATPPPGKAVTFVWSPSPDSSVIGYRIYASTNNKLDFQMIGTATGTNVIVTNTVLPTYYFVTARDASGAESDASNIVGLMGEIATVTVTGQHATNVAGPWLAYATPVYSGTTTNLTEVFRLAITRSNQWNTVSTP